MRLLFTIILLGLLSGSSFAQSRLYTVARPNLKRDIKIKKTKRTAKICPGMSLSAYPLQSLGVKIGDPFAITYKVYLHKHFALVVDGGTAARGLYQNYHRDRFTEFPEYDTLTYFNHSIDRDLVLQVRAVYQGHISKSIPGLDWYAGAGAQWRFIDVRYEYTFEPIPNSPEVGFDSQNLNAFGPEFTGGIEYSYENLPVTAFFELNYFIALNAQPELQRIMGGAGLRFRF